MKTFFVFQAHKIMWCNKNFSYRRKAKELSSIYHDVPVKPGAELVHWVQHVIRTRGAAHLRSPALGVPLYQRLFLDVIAFFSVPLMLFIMLAKRLCKRSKQNSNVEKAKTN